MFVGAHLGVRPGSSTMIANGELSGFDQGRHTGRPLRDRANAIKRSVWVVGAHLCVRPESSTMIANGELSGFDRGRHIGRPLRYEIVQTSLTGVYKAF